MEYWINRFLSEDGSELDLQAAKDLAKRNGINTFPLSKDLINSQLKKIYLREMNYWISSFTGKYGEESYLSKAQKYANLGGYMLPLTSNQIQETLFKIYHKKVINWCEYFMEDNGTMTHLEIAKHYAKILNIQIPLTKEIIKDKTEIIKEKEYLNYRENFLNNPNKYTLGLVLKTKETDMIYLFIELFNTQNLFILKDIKLMIKLWRLLNIYEINDDLIRLILEF